ncbi:hypothetical protein, partial [Pseudomonas paraeruginosa]|uniref:hypothetical protein n=1 Tax=Pseudomonas aeruginosa TaxID=287 RepID=UPI001C638D00
NQKFRIPVKSNMEELSYARSRLILLKKSASESAAYWQLKNARFQRCYVKTKAALSSERTRFQRRSRSFMGKNRDGTFSTESANSSHRNLRY